MTTRLTTKEVRQRLVPYGIQLVGDYVSYRQRLKLKCDKGHVWEESLSNMQASRRCPACVAEAKRQKRHEEVNASLSRYGLELISEYQMKVGAKGTFRHTCGYVWEASQNHTIHRHNCPNCANRRRYTPDEVNAKLAPRNIQLIGKYLNAGERTWFKCQEGHTWKATPDSVMRGSGCPYCAGCARLTAEIINKRLEAMATRRACPAYRRAHLAGIARRTADPEWLRKNAESTRRTAADPRWLARHRAMVARVTASPEWQKNHADAMARLALDPTWQEKHARVLELVHSDPEIIQRQVDGVRHYFNQPGVRERVAERNRQTTSTPEWRTAFDEGIQRRQADPVWWENSREAVRRTTATQEWKQAQRNARHKRMRPVIGRPIAGGAELYFIGASYARTAEFTQEGITACCHGKQQEHNGYCWRFAQPGEVALMMPPIPDYVPLLKAASERRIKPVIGTSVNGGLPVLLRGAAAIDAAGFHQGDVVRAVKNGGEHMGYTWHYASPEEIAAGGFGDPVPTRRAAIAVIGTPLAGGDDIQLIGSAGMRAAGFDPPNVTACCKGRIKSHRGYRWRYASPEEIGADGFGEPKPRKREAMGYVGTPVAGGLDVLIIGAAALAAAGFEQPSVSAAMKGRIKSHRGYRWRVADPEDFNHTNWGMPCPDLSKSRKRQISE